MNITYRTTLDLKLNNFTKSIDKPLALLHIEDGDLLKNCSSKINYPQKITWLENRSNV